MAGVLMRRVAGQSRRLHAALPASVASLGKPATFTPLIKMGKKPFVCMTGGSYLSEARARQCPAPDRFWAGQSESAWLIPCMVLVINDNLYGLMFVLSYICRCVHLSCLISICWNQG